MENFKKITETFWSDRYQCIVLNGKASPWTDVKTPSPDEVRIIRNNLTQENRVNHQGIASKLICS